MKTLDLNAYGITEMNSREMENIDGGIAPLVFIAIAAVVIAVVYICGGEGETTVEVSN